MDGLTQSDWSGGLQEQNAPEQFAKSDEGVNQSARLKGLVLDSEVELRSQWECQRMGTLPAGKSARAVHYFEARNASYLVCIASDGTIWWAAEPAVTASNTTTSALSWNQLGVSTPTADYRFIAEFPKKTAGVGQVPTLRIHCRAGSAPAVDIYEFGTSLAFNEISDYYPTASSSADFASGKAPRANGGAVWGDFLLLYDIDWLKDAPSGSNPTAATLSSLTTTRYSNAMWRTQAVDKTQVNPLAVISVGAASSTIVGLEPIDVGLLVFTTDAGNNSGVFLLRGDAGDPSLEPLRTGLGSAPGLSSASGHRKVHANWSATGSVVWLDRQGRVWNTNGEAIVQLDRHGPAAVAQAGTADTLAAAGRYLFVARNNRLLVFTGYQNDGAWSELVLPATATVRSMAGTEHAMYLVCDNQVWRYVIGNNGGQRGRVNGNQVDLTFSSATFAPRGPHVTTYWHEVGLRTGGTGTIQSVAVHDGSALTATAGSTVTTTVNTAAGPRGSVVVRPHGPSPEASITAVFRGDVTVESLSLWFKGGRNVR
jgi:hypothetical protein